MTATARDGEPWSAEGTLFESCNCALICRCHIHYANPADHDRCLFYWAVHFDRGAFGETRLDDLNAVLVGDTPKHMLEGNWTQAVYIDERADSAQRAALERIFAGQAGGPWTVLASFVGKRLDTLHVPIRYLDDGHVKSMEIAGRFSARVEAIRAADRTGEVKLVNLFNQIHGAEHVLARGTTEHAGQAPAISTQDTHALYSRFSWSGP